MEENIHHLERAEKHVVSLKTLKTYLIGAVTILPALLVFFGLLAVLDPQEYMATHSLSIFNLTKSENIIAGIGSIVIGLLSAIILIFYLRKVMREIEVEEAYIRTLGETA